MRVYRQFPQRTKYHILVVGPPSIAIGLLPSVERYSDTMNSEETSYQGAEAMLMHAPHVIILHDQNNNVEHDRIILARSGRLHGVPIIVVKDPRSTANNAQLMHRGFDVIVPMSMPADEIHALARAQASSRKTVNRDVQGHIIGDSNLLDLSNLLDIFQRQQSSGAMQVIASGVSGTIWFEMGKPIHAIYAQIIGEDAIIAILRQPEVSFDFQLRMVPALLTHNVMASVQGIIMEAARQNDEGQPNPLLLDAIDGHQRVLNTKAMYEWIADVDQLADMSFQDYDHIHADGDAVIVVIGECAPLLRHMLVMSKNISPEDIAILVDQPRMAAIMRIGPEDSRKISLIVYDPDHQPRDLPEDTIGMIVAPESVWSVYAVTRVKELIASKSSMLVGTIGNQKILDRIVSRSDLASDQGIDDPTMDFRGFLAKLLDS